MKIILILLFTLFQTMSLSAQVDCESFKTGKFILINEEYGDTYIKRTKKYQIEIGTNSSTGSKIKIKDRIVWIDECTYYLIPGKTKDPDNIITDNVIKFRILETANDHYVVHVSGLEDFEMNVRVDRR